MRIDAEAFFKYASQKLNTETMIEFLQARINKAKDVPARLETDLNKILAYTAESKEYQDYLSSITSESSIQPFAEWQAELIKGVKSNIITAEKTLAAYQGKLEEMQSGAAGSSAPMNTDTANRIGLAVEKRDLEIIARITNQDLKEALEVLSETNSKTFRSRIEAIQAELTRRTS